jgi:hypothetical protein
MEIFNFKEVKNVEIKELIRLKSKIDFLALWMIKWAAAKLGNIS